MPSLQQQNVAQLERDAERRGVPVHATGKRGFGRTKADLVRALQEPQKQFFDLPPELRAIVYKELLDFKDGRKTCHPQILATCKDINREASTLLYGKDVFQVTIKNQTITVHGRFCGSFNERGWIEKVYWPNFLRKVEKLQVSLIRPCNRVMTSWINHILYSLCAHLAGTDRLEQLELDLRPFDLIESSGGLRAVTYPLHALLCSPTVRLSDSKTVLIPNLQRPFPLHPRPSAETLSKAISMMKEVRSYEALITPPSIKGLDSESELRQAKADLESQLNDIESFDRIWELATKAATERMRKAFAIHHVAAVIDEQEKRIQEALNNLAELKMRRERNGADDAEAKAREERERAMREKLERDIERERGEQERRVRFRVPGIPPSVPQMRDGGPSTNDQPTSYAGQEGSRASGELARHEYQRGRRHRGTMDYLAFDGPSYQNPPTQRPSPAQLRTRRPESTTSSVMDSHRPPTFLTHSSQFGQASLAPPQPLAGPSAATASSTTGTQPFSGYPDAEGHGDSAGAS